MIKILEITSLDAEKWRVVWSQNGVRQTDIVACHQVWLEPLNEFMSYIVPENPKFFEIWQGEFRKEFFRLIETQDNSLAKMSDERQAA